MHLYGSHIRVLFVAIQEDTSKCAILQHKVFKLKLYNADMFQSSLVGHTQRMHINICIKL
jgi:hypothetical protein